MRRCTIVLDSTVGKSWYFAAKVESNWKMKWVEGMADLPVAALLEGNTEYSHRLKVGAEGQSILVEKLFSNSA